MKQEAGKLRTQVAQGESPVKREKDWPTPSTPTPAPGPASQDGGVELLDLLSQPPGLLLHLTALLLQLGDVLHGLLQRDGVAGL